MKQLIISGKHTPGVLSQVASLLGQNAINIECISGQSFGDEAVINLLTKDYITAKKILQEKEFNVKVSDILKFELINRPGELGKITKLIANEGINIDSAFLLSSNNEKTVVAFAFDDNVKAKRTFRKYITG